MRKTLNLSIELTTYEEIKRTIPNGKVSSLVDRLLKEYFKKRKREELKEAYQRQAKNQRLQAELKAIEEVQFEDLKDE